MANTTKWTSDVGHVLWIGNDRWFPIHAKKRGRIMLAKRKSDAILAAAAPELLEALRDMVSDHKCLSEATLKFARAAIDKATSPNDKLRG